MSAGAIIILKEFNVYVVSSLTESYLGRSIMEYSDTSRWHGSSEVKCNGIE